ncbi:uracil-DNA glycosylase [Mycoplasmopsis pullorum]|uniref:uracil-DNA glycosylase n=1 Tax=Mycoplasmopsis pullorum TaxID=48003 RepID=UPI0011195405|nr:uracil-DNA glycosylase [Mycoplasmopsis pullorum]TNK82219.1 uracil-DNA glycosylase [Mycoplasmopsis pullorum]TNK83133.1 uracil-DNA glycosylase [Mycoplasmopsis pullorum]TNK84750.1 uracil-DNA glycosylase [Mycoplasmopsis pullorum]TNK85411.1 uracil-DNA glycosylase [Mycoplasmopsis pullorum]TNK86033.1 uracil-DNA glycosylase [Mycoplasmopsis pullorum]
MKNSWLGILEAEGKKPYFQDIIKGLEQAGIKHNILPHQTEIFRTFEYFQVNETKVVILAQDPYPNAADADGLAFSSKAKKTPKSLANIFKEIKKDYPDANLSSNSLENWAKQGVLLLNTILTVNEHMPLSHEKFGWQQFTNEVILAVAKESKNVLFCLFGNKAHETVQKLHLDLKPEQVMFFSHPSPFSYKLNFENQHIFKRINDYLIAHNETPIDWSTNKED